MLPLTGDPPAVEGLQPELLEEQAEQWRALAAGVRETSQRAGQAGRGELAGTLAGVAHRVSVRKETGCAFGDTGTAGAALLYHDPRIICADDVSNCLRTDGRHEP